MKRRPPPRERTTLSLSGTVRGFEAKLCHDSSMALGWIMGWAASQGPKRLAIPQAGVVRRALSLYAQRLQATTDPAGELRALHAACTALRPDPEAQEAAEERLSQAIAAGASGEPIPPFGVVLRGPESVALTRAIDERAAALAEAVQAEEGFRRSAAGTERWARQRGRVLQRLDTGPAAPAPAQPQTKDPAHGH